MELNRAILESEIGRIADALAERIDKGYVELPDSGYMLAIKTEGDQSILYVSKHGIRANIEHVLASGAINGHGEAGSLLTIVLSEITLDNFRRIRGKLQRLNLIP